MSALNAPLQSTTSTTPTSATGSASQMNSLNEQDFMKLLTTELQHQDPTQPLNEQQLASEMALFSTATGVQTLNQSVSDLSSKQAAASLSLASSLIGKQVATSGDALVTDNNGSANGAFTLANSSSSTVVNVLDASGKSVAQVKLGSLGPGLHQFSWSGGAPNQAYSFSVAANAADGASIQATPLSVYTVGGVNNSSAGVTLTLSGNPTPLPLAQVQQVL